MLIVTDEDLKFNDFKKMIIQGLKVIAIIFIYSIMPIIIGSIIIINSNFLFSNTANNIYLKIPPELFLTVLITGIIASIFISIAIPHMIEKNH